MTQQLQINTILKQLHIGQPVQVSLHGWPLLMECSREEELTISALVYRGENFIPFSVRDALKKNPFKESSSLKTYLTLNEEAYTITLHYQGNARDFPVIEPLLDEFSWLTEQWWIYLDDQDRRDLVPLSVRRP